MRKFLLCMLCTLCLLSCHSQKEEVFHERFFCPIANAVGGWYVSPYVDVPVIIDCYYKKDSLTLAVVNIRGKSRSLIINYRIQNLFPDGVDRFAIKGGSFQIIHDPDVKGKVIQFMIVSDGSTLKFYTRSIKKSLL